MDDYETYYLLDEDDDMRNARVRRHGNRPSGLIRHRGPTGVRVVRPARPVVVAQPAEPVMAATSGGILGNLDRSELIEIAAQVLSALMPLPAAPVTTGDARDISNQTLYLTALAIHAKRGEQLRTLGSVIGKLLD